jgi:LytS/YehU family sensor histidine kinase
LQEGYLDIELERFSDRMSYTINVPDDVRRALVPTLILQPLIENAVKHGVGRSSEPIGIRIIARRDAERLSILVENDVQRGDGVIAPEGFGIGLRNVADRIRTRFGSEGSLTTTLSDSDVFLARVELPWRTA